MHRMQPVTVPLGPRAYSIVSPAAEPGGVGPVARRVCPKATTALVVHDPHTAAHANPVAAALTAAGLRVTTAAVPAGEAAKSLAELGRLYDVLAALPADRNTLVVPVGGGVVGDLAGFAAATFNRGLSVLMVPTTLLAMVDSSVGGKVAVNHPAGKNLIGAFHQPAAVWIDPGYLDTLPARDYRSGLAEVVKYGVALDADFFAYLEATAAPVLARDVAAVGHVVRRCCELKAAVVAADEREETGGRAVLNYGHTFAHAFETVGGYGAWSHGEAVAAGMACAAALARRLGRVDAGFAARQNALLETFGLPTRPDPAWPAADLIAVMRHDKKAEAGELRFVLPARLGHAELVGGVAGSVVAEVLQSCR